MQMTSPRSNPIHRSGISRKTDRLHYGKGRLAISIFPSKRKTQTPSLPIAPNGKNPSKKTSGQRIRHQKIKTIIGTQKKTVRLRSSVPLSGRLNIRHATFDKQMECRKGSSESTPA